MKNVFDENSFIIGIDFGNLTSTVSYFDFNQNILDIVDASGGYGKISIPTLVSYNIDSKDWIFGEYALLNKGFGNDFIFENIIDNLGKNLEYTVDNKKLKLSYILSKYLLFLMENIKNINPNAKIKGIVASISSYTSQNAIEELQETFKLANLDKILIKIVDDKECIIKEYLYKNKLDGDKILIIDYGNRELRVSIYQTIDKYKLKCIKTVFKSDIGHHKIYTITKNLIIKKFLEEIGKSEINIHEQNQIDIFTNQQFDIIFHRENISDVKLYYNFHYPPFQKVITKDELFSIISHFENQINIFFNEIFKDIKINKKDIKNIILTGGGIEIDFINKFIKSIFQIENNFKGRAKRIISDGACIIACQEMGVIDKYNIEIEDLNKIKNNIGIFVKNLGKDEFFPLINKNSFIYQEGKKIIFNLLKDNKLDFEVYLQEDNGNFKILKKIEIDLPKQLKRDKKTVRFCLDIKFNNSDEILFTIEDFGFGEIFSKTDFKREFLININ